MAHLTKRTESFSLNINTSTRLVLVLPVNQNNFLYFVVTFYENRFLVGNYLKSQFKLNKQGAVTK